MDRRCRPDIAPDVTATRHTVGACDRSRVILDDLGLNELAVGCLLPVKADVIDIAVRLDAPGVELFGPDVMVSVVRILIVPGMNAANS